MDGNKRARLRPSPLRDELAYQREEREREKERKLRESEDVAMPFREVPGGHRFALRPKKYVGITFIKTGERMAEIYSWNENAQRQSFPPDYMVYYIDNPRRSTTP